MKRSIILGLAVALAGCAGPDGRTDPLRTAGAGAALGAIGGLTAGAMARQNEAPRYRPAPYRYGYGHHGYGYVAPAPRPYYGYGRAW